MDEPKPCPLCRNEMRDATREDIDWTNVWTIVDQRSAMFWKHPDDDCALNEMILSIDMIPAWNRRAPVEWTVTREVLRAALRAGDEALDGSPPGIAMMMGGVAIVEALGGKVEG